MDQVRGVELSYYYLDGTGLWRRAELPPRRSHRGSSGRVLLGLLHTRETLKYGM